MIPEVVSRVGSPRERRGKRFIMPTACPICGTRVKKEGAATFCPAGLSCPAQLVRHLMHFASREAMNITGLGETTAHQLVGAHLVKSVADLYDLSPEQFLQLEGFGRRSAAAVYRAIQGAKDVLLDRFLYALGVPHAGRHAAHMLARACRTLGTLRTAGINELRKVAGIGPEIARSVCLFFEEPKNRRRASLGSRTAAGSADDSLGCSDRDGHDDRHGHHCRALGAGGLGVFIFRGLAAADSLLLLAGTIPAALIAIVADRGLEWMQQKVAHA